MKKVVRTVWISVLSGLAFLVACNCQNKLTRAERKQLKAERTALMEQIKQTHEEAIVYDNPDQVMIVKRNELELRNRLEEINIRLGDKKASNENGDQIGKIYNEIDSLQIVIDESMIEPCVYGPPSDIPEYKEWRLNYDRGRLMEQLDQLENAIQRREGACVYGSPEIIRKYGEETNRLKKEADDLRQRIDEMTKELEEEIKKNHE